MSEETFRRSFLKRGATATTGAGLLAGGGLASSGSETAISGNSITASVRNTERGTIPADITFGRWLTLDAVQTVLWDGNWEQTKAIEPDATTSSVMRPSEAVPELTLEHTLQFVQPVADAPRPIPRKLDYTATVTQNLLVSGSEDAVLIDSDVQFQTDYYADREQWQRQVPHTAYTIWNPEFHMWAPGTTTHEQAYRLSLDGYDVAIVGNGRWHAASARTQYRTGSPGKQQRSFDGCRMGLRGATGDEEQSAWQDIYDEADGWIDENDSYTVRDRSNRGRVDVGVETYAGTDPQIRWTDAFGFGDTAQKAADAAIAALESGYETERDAWTN